MNIIYLNVDTIQKGKIKKMGIFKLENVPEGGNRVESNENSRSASIQYSIWDTSTNNVKPIVPNNFLKQQPKIQQKVEKHIDIDKK
jgi:hypothetical protein